MVCSPIGAGGGGLIGGAGGFIVGVGTEILEESSPYVIAGAQWTVGAVSDLWATAWGMNTQSGPTFDQGMISLAQAGTEIRSTEGQPGQVRVQLQQGGANISSISLASSTGSVSKLQAQGGLAYVFMDGSTRDPTLFANSGFGGAIARASAKIQSLSPGGMVKGPYSTSIQELFTHNGQQYRIDVEILRGTQFVE